MPTIACTCEICAMPFTVSPYRLKLGKVRFCSKACLAVAQKSGRLVPPDFATRRRRYHWEPWQLDLLRTHYDQVRGLLWLCEHLPYPRAAIKSKARSLGLGRKLGQKQRPWTEKDITFLHKHLATWSLAKLALKLGRTQVAVQLKAKRLHLSKSSDGYTLRQLEPLLGMDAHKTRRMIVTGLLKASRKHTARVEAQGGDAYHVTDEALKAFITHHPEHVDLRRVDRDWFIDLLSDGALWAQRFQGIAAAIS